MKNTLLFILTVLVVALMLSGCYYSPYYSPYYYPYRGGYRYHRRIITLGMPKNRGLGQDHSDRIPSFIPS